MLTGGPPFTGDSVLSVLWKQMHQPPEPVSAVRPGIPADLDALVAQLLAKRPDDRPDSAGQVRDRLARLARLVTGPAATDTGDAANTQRMPATPIAPTRPMPAPGGEAGPPAVIGGGPRGPTGVARRVVTIGVAVVAALVIGLLLTHRPKSGGDRATPPDTGATSTSASVPDGTAEHIQAVHAAIDAQVQAGQLDAKTAGDLYDQLNEVTGELTEGKPAKAAKKVADLRDRLADLRHDEKITDTGYTAVLASLDQLAQDLPPARN